MSYKTYDTQQNGLVEFFSELRSITLQYALSGKKPQNWIDRENRLNELSKKFSKIRSLLESIVVPCHRCGKTPEVVSNIDCGIDGGPGPVSVKGVKIRCCCGLQTDTFSYYQDNRRQVLCLVKAIEQWNG